jgi:mannose-6-phosphate isomerase-like protein (cupin superfamily)
MGLQRPSTEILAGLTSVAILAAVPACQRTPAPSSSQQPPTPPAALSSYSPQQPYKQFAPGLLAQTVYVAEPTGRYAVEVWDLTVGPGRKSEAATLPGAAIFEIRSGAGTVAVAGRSREVRIGATFSLGEGESFTVANGSPEEALMIRATIVRARN